MRKLASIRKISNIRPIEGKDLIEQVNVDGWNVIVKKGEFKDGDLCVYIEIDSKLPERKEFEFLAKKKYIIKTMKMAGVRSEGIVFPLSILPRGKYVLDQDVTKKLGIVQYNAELSDEPTVLNLLYKHFMRYMWFRKIVFKFFKNSKITKQSTFPSWISKTDEERIQNKPKVLEMGLIWTATEKLDGSSATFGLRKVNNDFEYVVCSRNRIPTETDNNIWQYVSVEYGMEEVLHYLWTKLSAKESIVIQGEIIGPRVQGNKYKLDDFKFYMFNLVIDRKRYQFDTAEFEELLNDIAITRQMNYIFLKNINIVPTVYKDIKLDGKTVDDVLKMATFTTTLSTKEKPLGLAEGLVFRSYTNDGTAQLVDSFKAVSPDFLIKNGE